MNISIVTDSTCDIPDALVAQYGIIVVPQRVIWGEAQYRDRIDLEPVEFYRRLAVDPDLPHSSMPSPQDFLAAFEHAVDRGATQVLVLTVSSAMSGTYGVAKAAAEQANVPVAVVDSKGPTMTLGWQVLAAGAIPVIPGAVAISKLCGHDRPVPLQLVQFSQGMWRAPCRDRGTRSAACAR